MKTVPALLGIAAGAFLLSGDASASSRDTSPGDALFPLDANLTTGYSGPIDYSSAIESPFSPPVFDDMNTPLPNTVDLKASNLAAFLRLIRQRESEDDYSKLVGGGHFNSFVNHPFLTGEFKGIRRSDGRLTTAAGAYQITKSTWLDIGGIIHFGDFGKQAQDLAAVYLIRRRGAIRAIETGDTETAHSLLKNEWEFLVTARGTPQKVAQLFVQNGGVLA